MAGFWGKRKREEQAALDAQDADLARRARHGARRRRRAHPRRRPTSSTSPRPSSASGPTQELRDALTSVRQHLRRGVPPQPAQPRRDPRHPRGAAHPQRAHRAAVRVGGGAARRPHRRARRADRRARAAHPRSSPGCEADAAALSAPGSPTPARPSSGSPRATPADALRQVAENAAEAEQLLGFAEHSAGVAERRREAGQREQANLALEAATEAGRRAATLIDARRDLRDRGAARRVDARGRRRGLPRRPRRGAHRRRRCPPSRPRWPRSSRRSRSLPAAGVKTDPFAELTRLREANTGLDAAIAAARERAARPIPPLEHVRHAIDDADRQLAVARDVIAGHRGWIGADARTRLAEAERIRVDLDRYLGASAAAATTIDEDHREQAMAMARRVAYLASEALQLAQRDIDASRPQGGPGGWGPARRRRRPTRRRQRATSWAASSAASSSAACSAASSS